MMILKWVLPAIQLRVSLSFTLNLPHLFSASDSELERERERERERGCACKLERERV